MTEPFLRWAGGKRRVLPVLRRFYPSYATEYHEPFVGGGAVFFDYKPAMRAFISDANPDLIDTYIAVRDYPEAIISQLLKLGTDPKTYETIRSTPGIPYPGNVDDKRVWTAVRFLYINRVGFNGLWRVNKIGQVNTPYGKPKFSRVTDQLKPDTIRTCSRLLQGVDIRCLPWEKAMKIAPLHSFWYVDPPYDTTEAQSFTGYTVAGFGETDQYALAARLDGLRKAGAVVVASNADSEFIRKLYTDWHVYRVEVRRSIAAEPGRHKVAAELIISSSPRMLNGVLDAAGW